MGIYEELQARGLIAQVTDEERIRNLINNGEATFDRIIVDIRRLLRNFKMTTYNEVTGRGFLRLRSNRHKKHGPEKK